MDILKKTSEYILTASLILCAVIYSTQTITKRIPVRDLIWVCAAIILTILVTIQGVDFSVFKRKIFWAFGGYLVFSLISLINVINFGEWFYDICRTALMLVYLFLAFSVVTKDIAKPIVLLAIGLGIYGLFNLPLHLAPMMGNKNFWGQAHFLLLIFCLYSVFNYKGFWRDAGLIGGLLSIQNICFSYPKSVWLGCIVSVLACLVFNRKALIIAIILILIIGGAFLANPKQLHVANSINGRLDQWCESMRMVKDHFMIGAGQWKIVINDYSRNFTSGTQPTIEAGKTTMFKSPHNDFVWVLAETGPFGFLCYLSIFLFGLFYAYKSHNIFIFAGIAGYMAIACFSFPREKTFHSMFSILLLALSLKGYHGYIKSKRSLLFIRMNFCIITLLILGMVSLSFGSQYIGQYNYVKAHKAAINGIGDPLEYLSHISPLATLDYHTMPYYWHRATIHKYKGNKVESFADYKMAYKANPNNIYVLASMGHAFFYNDQPDAAIECYEKALVVRPDFTVASENIKMIKADIAKKQ